MLRVEPRGLVGTTTHWKGDFKVYLGQLSTGNGCDQISYVPGIMECDRPFGYRDLSAFCIRSVVWMRWRASATRCQVQNGVMSLVPMQ